MMKVVFLPTDVIFFVLLLAAGASLYLVLRDNLRGESLRRMLRGRVGGACSFVLCLYLSIAFLDSLHFRLPLPQINAGTIADATVDSTVDSTAREQQVHYSPEVLSVLDVVLSPLRLQVEKSYSSPFATHLLVKEVITDEDNSVSFAAPRLLYGGAHLKSTEKSEVMLDIAVRVCLGITLGVGMWTLLVGVFCLVTGNECKVSAWRLLRMQKVDMWVRLLCAVVVGGAVLVCLAPAYHVLGTDQVGRDVLYITFKSVRTGVVIGLITTCFLLPVGITLGVLAGYVGGWVDDVIQYIYITLNSIPGVLLIVSSVMITEVYLSRNSLAFETALSRADVKLVTLCFILGLTSWTGLCRMLRAETLKLRELEYIQAAKGLGVSLPKILSRHILPNLFHLVLIAVAIDFSGFVLAEAVLTYIGVGVDPAIYSWGNMINGARLELARTPLVWWNLAAAFVGMFGLVLSANIFAELLRQALNPRERGRLHDE